MTSFTLPPGHHHDTLDSTSPPVVLGRACPITGERLRTGDAVIVCDARPGSDPIRAEGWATSTSCPHCGAPTGYATYVPPVWGATPPPAALPARPSSPAGLLGPLAALLLLGMLAIGVAAVVFLLRTRAADEPPVSIATTTAAGTATAAAATATTAAATATALALAGNPTSTATPTPLPATAGLPTPTLQPTPALLPSPTLFPSPVPPPTATVEPLPAPFTALLLIDPEDDSVIRALRADDIVDLREIDRNHLTVLAEVDTAVVESVSFFLDGAPFCPRGNCVENTAPFYMGGDQGGNAYDDWDWSEMLGSHTLSAIACTGDNATGACFPAVAVNLVIRR